MQFAFNLTGPGEALLSSFKVGATVTANQAVMLDTNLYGDVIPCTTTGAANAFGATLGAATYDATPTAAEGGEGVVEVIWNPLAVFRCTASGTTAAGGAMANLNLLVQDTASATVITDTAVSTVDMSHGTICGVSGVNKNIVRRITSDSASVSTTVTVAFPTSSAVLDTFLRVPWGPGLQKLQFCTEITEADAQIAVGTGGNIASVRVDFDTKVESDPKAYVYIVFADHFLNQLS